MIGRSDRGSVAAEFAVALPAVLLVLATALGGIQVAALQLRAQDASADAARALGRGESAGRVASRLGRQIPGATLRQSTAADLVCVWVSATASGAMARLGVRVTARSCAMTGGR